MSGFEVLKEPRFMDMMMEILTVTEKQVASEGVGRKEGYSENTYGSNEYFRFYYDFLSEAIEVEEDYDDIASKLSRIFPMQAKVQRNKKTILIGKYSIGGSQYFIYYDENFNALTRMRIIDGFYNISGKRNNKMVVASVYSDDRKRPLSVKGIGIGIELDSILHFCDSYDGNGKMLLTRR